jgi:aryl-alcohol dehydrogenase-like predicted oxidoreductase
VKTRALGPFQVAEIGFGCMNLNYLYGPPMTPAEVEALVHEAVALGVDHFDTAALYAFGANEELVGRALGPYRSRIVLATKGGMAGEPFPEGMKRVIDGSPGTIRRHCEDSLRRLRTDVIDLYYLHRWDKKVPIEESVGAMAGLVREGKVRAIGLSEVSATTLQRARAVHPIAAVQSEYSPAARNAELGVLRACAEGGTAYVAFGSLMRGFLGGALRDVSNLHESDIRRILPRFSAANFARNVRLLDGWGALAREAGCTPAQLALAWLLTRGPHVIPLPGTRSVAHLRENVAAASLQLPAGVIERIDHLVNDAALAGERYGPQAMSEVDTERMPASG